MAMGKASEEIQVLAEGSVPPGEYVCLEVPDSWGALAGGLHDAELAYSAQFGPRRRISWAAGRIALRRALARVGVADCGPLLSTSRGAPALPGGLRGSISHKGRVAVGFAAAGTTACLGADVESTSPERPAIYTRALTGRERASIDQLAGWRRWAEVVERFSVKEAIFKAVDPILGRVIPLTEVDLVRGEHGWSTGNALSLGGAPIALRVVVVQVRGHVISLVCATPS